MTKNKKEKLMEEKQGSLLEEGSEDVREQDEFILELQEKLVVLEEENEKLKNDYAKAYADTENTRRRLQMDAETTKKYRVQSFALEILPAIDNLERALAIEADAVNESYRKGVEMIYNQIVQALKNEGVEEVDALDKEFDPNFHQAVLVEKADGVKGNIVTGVLQKGYKIKDRILRPAMVKVSE